ncbi:bile acid:sodium symporter family protein [Salisediminibacterium halotolerans]|uniref:bile acid:sodium symporter family protein n=1 Tax=Salisediminibacterium halotolerans TaxID=517425 RepID=UPI000EB1385A|nr:bile acid:sodium symporter family protein [Salisediminibacterium halotolerans]RLJ71736.1 BASS family bile acid:Na+ symporter [Actinophytocola xinjiangensis]RPE86886.1 BASS family bile acid:Na+ symporter [Salisediminibacterium halotolerans]TWG32949.1 BASS family bile acid:Na+ symporter [Salisediminibacterium halotolerans]GEL08214.1 sodium transporter [Salisediminibacterium halotolerans]
MKGLQLAGSFMSRYFAIIVIFVSVIAFFTPDAFVWIAPYITILLGVIMFGMGTTMRPEDFKIVLQKPFPVLFGVVAQFVVMPLAALGIAYAMQLPPELAAGLVLVGACPGGTASNVMVYLSRGDVPVSVAMTSVSTMLAPVLTPLAVFLLADQWLPVGFADMFMSIVQVIIIPIALGLLVSKLLPAAVDRAQSALPMVSVTAILLIVAAVISGNTENLVTSGIAVFTAVILHNSFGLLLGYFTAKSVGLDETKRRAISIEVGMQNSGLGAALATAHFTPMAALPSAIFSVWHNISGPALVSFWNKGGSEEINGNEKDKS